DAGRYEQSRVAFAQAYALEPLAELLINLGHAELKTGRYVEGSRHIAKALREAEIGLGERRAAERALETAEPYVARVKVVVNPDGAAIVIDGEDVGTSPMIYVWYLEPGEHRIRASKEGFRHDEQTVGISRGQAKTVNLTLAPANASRKVVTPGAPPKSLDSGLDAGVSDEGDRSVVPLIVGGGLGAAGIAAGIVFTLDAKSKREDRDVQLDALQNTASANACGQNTGNAVECASIKDLDKKANTSQTIGIVGFAAGGAAILGGVVLYFLLPANDESDQARLTFTPVINTETAGLNLSGNF
ncbi:MAG TPA: PEGA domain-containing protein, partial [Polyangiaceae bacterium]|nr:PEGA domain-containing protein [Polyangiaceae bacterium]